MYSGYIYKVHQAIKWDSLELGVDENTLNFVDTACTIAIQQNTIYYLAICIFTYSRAVFTGVSCSLCFTTVLHNKMLNYHIKCYC